MNKLFIKTTLLSASLITVVMLSTNAVARDDKQMYSIADALSTPAAKEKLDANVKLYFGNQFTPAVASKIGEWATNKKTNGFNKSDKEGCEWAFLAAVMTLQERAKKEGANAVVNIKSNYKGTETISETEYMCGNGTFVTGVAFKGTGVKFK